MGFIALTLAISGANEHLYPENTPLGKGRGKGHKLTAMRDRSTKAMRKKKAGNHKSQRWQEFLEGNCQHFQWELREQDRGAQTEGKCSWIR